MSHRYGGEHDSAELKGPGRLLRIRPEIINVGPKSAPKPDETKPKMPGAVPTNRHKPMPIDFGPVSLRFEDDPKFVKLWRALRGDLLMDS